MTMNLYRSLRTPLAIVAAIGALLFSLPAAAGCLQEFSECGDCARKHMWEAIRNFDLQGMADAELEGLDCEIDLIHCVLYAHHHEYSCDS